MIYLLGPGILVRVCSTAFQVREKEEKHGRKVLGWISRSAPGFAGLGRGEGGRVGGWGRKRVGLQLWPESPGSRRSSTREAVTYNGMLQPTITEQTDQLHISRAVCIQNQNTLCKNSLKSDYGAKR